MGGGAVIGTLAVIVGRWLFRILIRYGIGLAIYVAGEVVGVRLTRRQFLGAAGTLLAMGIGVYWFRDDIADMLFGEDSGEDAEIIVAPDQSAADLINSEYGPLPVRQVNEPGAADLADAGDDFQRMSADQNRAATEHALDDIDQREPLVAPDQIFEHRITQARPTRRSL